MSNALCSKGTEAVFACISLDREGPSILKACFIASSAPVIAEGIPFTASLTTPGALVIAFGMPYFIRGLTMS